jgi:hypothetical protein
VDKRRWRIARWRRRLVRTRGGGSTTTGAMQQTGGEASADRVRQSVKRIRGGGGATRDVAITSQKTRGKREAPADKEVAVS